MITVERAGNGCDTGIATIRAPLGFKYVSVGMGVVANVIGGRDLRSNMTSIVKNEASIYKE